VSRLVIPFTLALLAGCATLPAVSPGVLVRPETRTECAANCDAIGMRLAAVVLIRNSAGCVCEAREGSAGANASRGVAVAAGAHVIVLEEEEEQRQRDARPPAGSTGASYPGAPGQH
jgi:hypothetical protein